MNRTRRAGERSLKLIDLTQAAPSSAGYDGPVTALCRFLVCDGSGTLDDTSFENGLCALVPAGSGYRLRPAVSDTSMLELSFSQEFLPPGLISSLADGTLCLLSPAPEYLEYVRSFCRMLPLRSGAASRTAAEAGLTALLSWYSLFLSKLQTGVVTHAQVLADQARDIIRTEYMNDLSLQSVAARLFVNPCYLSTIFHQSTGTTFRAYLRDVRLEHTCHLLVETNHMITDIAMQTGFSSTAYLISSFRKAYGITPNAYRVRQNQQ